MVYNLTIILKSSLKEADKKKLIKKVKDLFEKAKITEKDLGQKALAYPIQKEVSGIYVNMIIETETVATGDIEKILNTDTNILRYLLIRNK